MKKIIYSTILMFSMMLSLVRAQELKPLKENLTFNVDGLGDARIQMSMSFTAEQWDNFKKSMGNNTDILKRNMERTLPAYYLQNFDYKEDQMNRSYTLSFDALGMAKINENGQWQVDVDLKKPDITKLSDNAYTLTNTYNAQGLLIQQVSKLIIPDGASDIKQSENSFGKAIFTYNLSPATHGINLLFLGIGIILIMSGVAFYFLSSQKIKVAIPLN